MSKAKLKKELENLDVAQLRGMILDAYDANPAFKNYFEFFLNPDVAKLREKYLNDFRKEAARQKWGVSRMRVTRLKNGLKEFMGYKLGAAEDIQMMACMMWIILSADAAFSLATAHYSYFRTLMNQIIICGDENECADFAHKCLTEIKNIKGLSREIRWILGDEFNE